MKNPIELNGHVIGDATKYNVFSCSARRKTNAKRAKEQHTFWLLLRRRPANSRRHILVACTKIICFYSIWHTDCAADKERIDYYIRNCGCAQNAFIQMNGPVSNVCALSMFALEFVSTAHFAYTRSNDRWNRCRPGRCLALKTK